MLTSLTIKYHFPLAILTMGLHGIGFSFTYATAIGAAQKWFPESRKGIVGSIVISGYGYGSLIWIPLQTAFVNPENVKAVYDPRCNNTNVSMQTNDEDNLDCDNLYYSDHEMLSRIPWMFLLLGGIYFICGIVATMLITEPHEVSSETMKKADSKRKEKDSKNIEPLDVLKTKTFYQVSITLLNSNVFSDPYIL